MGDALMAGDWIKMRADLFTHPKVIRISSALKADTLRTVGGLMSAWCLFDAHSEDGRLEGYTADVLDAHLHWPGFSKAMADVGWLEQSEDNTLILPRFDTHNGQSAKRRAQDADRKRTVRKMSASEADKMRTREEKRREENIKSKTNTRTLARAICPQDVDSKVWGDFQALRKNKRAPLTETALAGITRESNKAGMTLEAVLRICCERGWQGFKAEWLTESKSNGHDKGPPWWSSNEGIVAKATELGITPKKGESYPDLKQRISQQINQ